MLRTSIRQKNGKLQKKKTKKKHTHRGREFTIKTKVGQSDRFYCKNVELWKQTSKKEMRTAGTTWEGRRKWWKKKEKSVTRSSVSFSSFYTDLRTRTLRTWPLTFSDLDQTLWLRLELTSSVCGFESETTSWTRLEPFLRDLDLDLMVSWPAMTSLIQQHL